MGSGVRDAWPWMSQYWEMFIQVLVLPHWRRGRLLGGTLKSCWSKRARRPWPEHLRPALRPWVCACLSCRMWWCRVFRFNPEPWAPRGRFAQPAHSHHFRSHSTDLTTRGLPRYVCPPNSAKPRTLIFSSTQLSLWWQCLESDHSCLCHKSSCLPPNSCIEAAAKCLRNSEAMSAVC